MKIDFSTKWAKAAIDISMLLFFVISWLYTTADDAERNRNYSHCILGFVWIGFIAIHLLQHGRFVLSLNRKSVVKKNKIIVLTLLSYFMMIISILLFFFEYLTNLKEFHHFISHLLVLLIIVHMIQMRKKFFRLFPSTKQN